MNSKHRFYDTGQRPNPRRDDGRRPTKSEIEQKLLIPTESQIDEFIENLKGSEGKGQRQRYDNQSRNPRPQDLVYRPYDRTNERNRSRSPDMRSRSPRDNRFMPSHARRDERSRKPSFGENSEQYQRYPENSMNRNQYPMNFNQMPPQMMNYQGNMSNMQGTSMMPNMTQQMMTQMMSQMMPQFMPQLMAQMDMMKNNTMYPMMQNKPEMNERKRDKSLDRFEDMESDNSMHSAESFKKDKSPPIIDRREWKKSNRIPTPPPPPSFSECKKTVELLSKKESPQKPKPEVKKDNINVISALLDNKDVSLSSLLEAAMETTGSKRHTEDPELKKEIISTCEKKISQLYKLRVTGEGVFMPDPIPKSSTDEIEMMRHHPYLEFVFETKQKIWNCPNVQIPERKPKPKLTNKIQTVETIPTTVPYMFNPVQTITEINRNITQPYLLDLFKNKSPDKSSDDDDDDGIKRSKRKKKSKKKSHKRSKERKRSRSKSKEPKLPNMPFIPQMVPPPMINQRPVMNNANFMYNNFPMNTNRPWLNQGIPNMSGNLNIPINTNVPINPMQMNPQVNPMQMNPQVNPMQMNPQVNPMQMNPQVNPMQMNPMRANPMPGGSMWNAPVMPNYPKPVPLTNVKQIPLTPNPSINLTDSHPSNLHIDLSTPPPGYCNFPNTLPKPVPSPYQPLVRNIQNVQNMQTVQDEELKLQKEIKAMSETFIKNFSPIEGSLLVLKRLQICDSTLNNIKNLLQGNNTAIKNMYTIVNGLLCRIDNYNNSKCIQIVIPKTSTYKSLVAIHNANHDLKINDLVSIVEKCFYDSIPDIREDFRIVIKNCKECNRSRTRSRSRERKKNEILAQRPGAIVLPKIKVNLKSRKSKVKSDNKDSNDAKDKEKESSDQNKPKSINYDPFSIYRKTIYKSSTESKTESDKTSPETIDLTDNKDNKLKILTDTKEVKKYKDMPIFDLDDDKKSGTTTPTSQKSTDSIMYDTEPSHTGTDNSVDFKTRVRNTQLMSEKLKELIDKLENGDQTDAYLIKGTMLCQKLTINATPEIRIVADIEHIDVYCFIVHTMAKVHAPFQKSLDIFKKHFIPIDGIEDILLKVVQSCGTCTTY